MRQCAAAAAGPPSLRWFQFRGEASARPASIRWEGSIGRFQFAGDALARPASIREGSARPISVRGRGSARPVSVRGGGFGTAGFSSRGSVIETLMCQGWRISLMITGHCNRALRPQGCCRSTPLNADAARRSYALRASTSSFRLYSLQVPPRAGPFRSRLSCNSPTWQVAQRRKSRSVRFWGKWGMGGIPHTNHDGPSRERAPQPEARSASEGSAATRDKELKTPRDPGRLIGAAPGRARVPRRFTPKKRQNPTTTSTSD